LKIDIKLIEPRNGSRRRKLTTSLESRIAKLVSNPLGVARTLLLDIRIFCNNFTSS
jgi:hypothetical protein